MLTSLQQPFSLEVLEGGEVVIHLPHKPEWVNFRIHFCTEHWKKRTSVPLVLKEIIVKTLLGRKKQYQGANLFDLTGGLGRDSFIFARAGFSVHTFEENESVYPILKAVHHSTIRHYSELNWHVVMGSFLENKSLFLKIKPTLIFVDPMFEFQRRKSLPSKEIQLLSELTSGKVASISDLQAWLKWLSQFPFIEKILLKRHPHHSLRDFYKLEEFKNWTPLEINTKAISYICLQKNLSIKI